MERDTIAKGFENVAIDRDKQNLIYELSEKKEFHHPLKIITRVKKHKIRKGRAEKSSYHHQRGVRYHYLAGKVNYTAIAKATGVSICTVIRYLKLQHRKAREEGEYHQDYMNKRLSGKYLEERRKAKEDRKRNPIKWRDRERKWLYENQEKKKEYDKKQYLKKNPPKKYKCIVCKKEFITTAKSKGFIECCRDKNCREEYLRLWKKDYMRNWLEKNKKPCVDCGKLIHQRSIRCPTCQNKRKRGGKR